MNTSDGPEPHESNCFPHDSGAFFDQSRVAKHISPRYVAWIDLMGARGIMGRSLAKASNFIGKIHGSVLLQYKELPADAVGLNVYPVIDGAYITTPCRRDLDKFIFGVMYRLASSFVNESNPEHQFLVRGGIALGNVLEGNHLAKGFSALKDSPEYSSSVALGSAIGQAYSAEGQAPPFGFCVDVTARSFSLGEQPSYPTRYWRWWNQEGAGGPEQSIVLSKKLEDYFDWLSRRLLEHEYPKDSFERHKALMQEYFRV